ncbi:MAG TPA: metal ABC transporter permease [Actinomycetota bacterium]|nr:metal ABC transporter permease [Actinomycetota bacterium]
MPWPFEREYMQLALAAGIVVGVCAPLMGAFVVQRRMSLLGDGIGHLAFAGVAAALLAGVAPLWGAMVVAVVGALAIELLRSRGRATGDLALAIAFYVGIAGGVVLLGLGGSLDASVFAYLFGSVLTVSAGEVATVAALGLLVILAVVIGRRALFAIVADEEWSRVAGLPVATFNALLSVLTALVVVAAMRVVGLLLVAALMVLPVAGARIVAGSFAGVLRWASAIGTLSVVIGLVAARAWGLAPSGAIVIVAALAFGVAAALRRARSGGVAPGPIPTEEASS